MKKLLTILLTLVLGVCLFNLNSNYVIADDSNDAPTGGLRFKADGVYNNKGAQSTKISDPSTVGVNNYTTSSAEITLDISNTENSNTALYIDTGANDYALTINPNNETLNIIGGSSGTACGIYFADKNLTINSNGKKLNVESKASGLPIECNDLIISNTNVTTQSDISCGARLTNNLILKDNSSISAISNGDGQNVSAIRVTTNLTINDGCTLEAQLTNKDNSDGAIRVGGTFTYPTDTYEIKGTEDGSKKDLVDVVFDDNQHYFVLKNDTTKKAKYVIIRPKEQPQPEPTPSPSPSKKDESCEKVIGPTWHWNNEKGICEEYATVGTATR